MYLAIFSPHFTLPNIWIDIVFTHNLLGHFLPTCEFAPSLSWPFLAAVSTHEIFILIFHCVHNIPNNDPTVIQHLDQLTLEKCFVKMQFDVNIKDPITQSPTEHYHTCDWLKSTWYANFFGLKLIEFSGHVSMFHPSNAAHKCVWCTNKESIRRQNNLPRTCFMYFVLSITLLFN